MPVEWPAGSSLQGALRQATDDLTLECHKRYQQRQDR